MSQLFYAKHQHVAYLPNHLICSCSPFSRLRLHGGVMGLKTSTLEGRVTFLKGMGLTPKELQRAMLNAPAFLTYSLQTRIPQFIDIFTKMQLSHNEIMRIIIKCPTLVGLSMVCSTFPVKTHCNLLHGAYLFLIWFDGFFRLWQCTEM